MPIDPKPVVLVAASTWFPLSARLAMAFVRHGVSVPALCPAGHPLALVPGIGKLYRYRGTQSLRSLRRAILAAQPDLVVPCDDGVVQQLHALHAKHSSLRPLIERSLGDPASYPILDSRERLLALAVELGIHVPLTRSIASESSLAEWPLDDAVLKADGSAGGTGVAITHSVSSRLAAYRKLAQPLSGATALKRLLVNSSPLSLWSWRTQPTRPVVAQQFIPGPPANSMIACWQGEVLASVAVETLSSQGPTGAATVVRFIHNPQIEEACRKIARRLNLSGFHGLDFILQHDAHGLPTGDAYLIELNPRCTQLGHFVLPLQGDLAGVLLAALTGKPQPPPAPNTTISSDTVAFYPQALIWNPNTPYIATGYHDLPHDAPQLTAELLLEEWPYRQLPARLYHHFFPPGRDRELPPTSQAAIAEQPLIH